VIFGLFESLLF
jgi:hypothetical protein